MVGLVTDVACGPVVASVELVCGPHLVEAVVSAEAVRELGLKPGGLAVAVVKATEVVVERVGCDLR